MRTAQRLFEGVNLDGETVGLITYMRTDSVQLSGEALAACRRQIAQVYGDRYLPEKPRAYKTRTKNAQEAHEAIRPTDVGRTPHGRALSRRRSAPPVRADLEAHARQPDGERPARPCDRRDPHLATGRSACAPPARPSPSTAFLSSTRKAATTRRRTTRTAACCRR